MPAANGHSNEASIHDVAREAGVSRATAARALGGYGSVSEKARVKVLAAAERLGYFVNAVARSMVTGHTMTLGALIADVANPFFAKVMRGFTDGAREVGYDVILVNTDESAQAEAHGLQVLIENRVDGMLIAPASQHRYEHFTTALERGHAMVQVDRYIPGLATDVVVVDNYQASYQAVKRVIEAGHTLIATPKHGGFNSVGEPNLVSTMEERFRGYADALADAGLEVPEEYHCVAANRESVRQTALALLRSKNRPTALFGLDDSFSLGIIDAIYAAELDIPKDISFFAFDDTDWTTVIRPPLSVVSQPAYELGIRAARTLIRRIDEPAAGVSVCTLPTTWVGRSSVGAPKTARLVPAQPRTASNREKPSAKRAAKPQAGQ
ncbi:MAG: LacI family transcriptional regulator [Propionibacteriaceae bacterium]|nr:LacI family transcriptional regulator [Propionibacteriaceae bacterium]